MNCLFAALILAMLVPVPARGQSRVMTIPEKVALARQHGAVTTSVSEPPSGLGPTVQEVLHDTDILVECTIAKGRSYLSPDQTEIYTGYQIQDPVFFYQAQPFATSTPGEQEGLTTFTRWGGTIVIDGFKWDTTLRGFAPLAPGARLLVLLHRKADGKYWLAGGLLGVLAIADGRVRPWWQHRSPFTAYSGMKVADAVASMLATLHEP